MGRRHVGPGHQGTARRLASRMLAAITASLLVLAGLGPLGTPASVDAQVSTPLAALYAASGSNGVAGTLYYVNSANGAATTIGPLLAPGGLPVGLTGLAMNPISQVLYGSTGNLSPNFPRTLVAINPTNAAVTVIGAFNPPTAVCAVGGGALPGTMQDLTFSPDGALFGFCNGTLFLISQTTGAATTVGTATYTGGSFAGGNGVTFQPLLTSPTNLWVAPRAADGPIFRINVTNGQILQTLPLIGGSNLDSFAALTTDADGTLLAVGSNGALPAVARLLAINVTTGAITVRGTLPNDTDAITLSLAPVVSVVPVATPTQQTIVANDDKDKKGEAHHRNNSRSNKGNDDEHTQGNVVGVRCTESDPVPTLENGFIVHPDMVPYVVIANRDAGAQQLLLIHDAARDCSWIQVGRYISADGEKQSEELLHAHEVEAED